MTTTTVLKLTPYQVAFLEALAKVDRPIRLQVLGGTTMGELRARQFMREAGYIRFQSGLWSITPAGRRALEALGATATPPPD